ncbi:flavodoxin family protein [Candidatus Bathyarchaeota archaeon]|nr:flavodoxin family protein [Candidatus Bathyarchaeota archaeon]
MILGLCGSPRAKTTEYVLRAALDMLEDAGYGTEFWGVRGKRIEFCTHCDACLGGDGCVIDDDVQQLYPLLAEAEALVVTTPVYNGGVSAQIKAVMDRTRALLAKDHGALKDKPGIAIAVGGDRAGGQELAIQQVHTFYTLNGMTPISGGFFGANLGASMWSKDTMEGIMEDEEGMRSLRKTVKRLVEHLGGRKR